MSQELSPRRRKGPAKDAAAASPAGRKGRPGAVAPRERGAAREALLAAARAEFDEAGFEGTDTNRIARRAGYAPQTFYRHFADKTAIFVETYHRWLADEWKDLQKAQGKGALESARILLEHHAKHREFRRSLRRLTLSEPAVRAARAESRKHQLDLVDGEDKGIGRGRSRELRIALLLCIERIADAAADGELGDLGLNGEEQATLLADVMRRLR